MRMILHYRENINAPLVTQMPVTIIQEGDREAHEIQVELFDGDKPFLVDGMTVSGFFMLADGRRVALGGTAAGSIVSSVLTDDCYTCAGAYAAYLRIGRGHMLRTILRIAGYIEGEGSGPVVDPGHKIPTPQELQAMVEACERAEQGANDGAGKANTAAGAANTAAGKANEAAGKANEAAKKASEAAGAANTAAGAANTAARAANEAAGAANEAAGEARQAAGEVNAAIRQAETAAGEASTAAGEARQAVTDIAAAKTEAEQAVQDAQTAVQNAEAWSGAMATAETIPHGQTPTVTVTDGPEGRKLHFKVPEGAPGAQGEPGKGLPEGGANGQIPQRDDSVPGGIKWVDAALLAEGDSAGWHYRKYSSGLVEMTASSVQSSGGWFERKGLFLPNNNAVFSDYPVPLTELLTIHCSAYADAATLPSSLYPSYGHLMSRQFAHEGLKRPTLWYPFTQMDMTAYKDDKFVASMYVLGRWK